MIPLKIVAMLLLSKQILFIDWDFHARYYAALQLAGLQNMWEGRFYGLIYPKNNKIMLLGQLDI